MARVLEIAKKLNRVYKNDKLAITADVMPSYKRLPCNDLGADFPLYGGLPYGRIVTISGKEHSGKTTGACTFLAAYQRTHPDKTCVFVDVEHALDKEFQSAMTGLDLTTLLYLNPEGMSGEQILDAILELQDSDDIGMIVLDSIASLVSSRDYDTDIEKDNGMAASIAKPLAKFIRKMLDTLAAKDNILLLINQVRQVGTTFTGAAIYDEPGGHSPKYYASVKLRFGTRTFTNGDKVDCRDGENADGFRLTFATTKNKTASTQRGGGFLTFRYDKGLDWAFDLLEVAIKYEFIERPNSMTYILMNLETGEPYLNEEGNPLKFVGKQKLRDFLSSNIEFQNEYLAMLNRYIQATAGNYGSLLDARTLAAINAEEYSTNGEDDGTSDKQDESSD
jgi:RecA/RadA recombinase